MHMFQESACLDEIMHHPRPPSYDVVSVDGREGLSAPDVSHAGKGGWHLRERRGGGVKKQSQVKDK